MNDQKLEFRHNRHELKDSLPPLSPFVIHVDPCGACNFKCKFCPCNYSDYRANDRHKLMDFKLFEKVAHDLAEFKEQVKVVSLYAFGEPLMNRHFPQMVSLLKDNNLCREVRVSTNGFYLQPELNRRIIDSRIDLIRISIEALSSETYLEICGVNVDFEKFIDNIANLYQYSRGTKTRISAKLITSTLTEESDIQKFIKLFSPISDYYFVEAQGNYWPHYESDSRPMNNTRVLSYSSIQEAEQIICGLPFEHITVFPTGDVGICSLDWRMDTTIGNISNESLLEIWKGEKLFNIRKKFLTGKRCEVPSCNVCTFSPVDTISFDDAGEIMKRLQEYRQ